RELLPYALGAVARRPRRPRAAAHEPAAGLRGRVAALLAGRHALLRPLTPRPRKALRPAPRPAGRAAALARLPARLLRPPGLGLHAHALRPMPRAQRHVEPRLGERLALGGG